jgi:hypothetical protein
VPKLAVAALVVLAVGVLAAVALLYNGQRQRAAEVRCAAVRARVEADVNALPFPSAPAMTVIRNDAIERNVRKKGC